MPTFPPGSGRFFTIFTEIAGIVLRAATVGLLAGFAVGAAMAGLTALAPGGRSLFMILSKVAGALFDATAARLPARLGAVGAAVRSLTTFPTGFGCALTVVSKVSGTVLATDMACAGRLFTILGKVSGVTATFIVGHKFPLFNQLTLTEQVDSAEVQRIRVGRVVFTSGVISKERDGGIVRLL